jgi:polyisoprenoid-binding protein YceI
MAVKRWMILVSAATLAACSPQSEVSNEPVTSSAPTASTTPESAAVAPVDVPAGAYTLDPAHTSVIFKISHLGFSNYTARFKKSSAQLQFDPTNLAAATVEVTVDANSLETDYPDPATVDFNAQLLGEQWLNGAQFPAITFRSTSVEPTGPRTMRINGELSMRGVTRPMTLEATLNGGYASHPMEKSARIGFSAHGTLKRSDFGMSMGMPAPGTTFGVGDEVTAVIETEFTGPPAAEAPVEPATAAQAN